MIQIALSSLLNSELYTLALRIKERCAGVDLEVTGLSTLYNLFLDQFNKYEQAIQKLPADAEEMAMADQKRDDFFIGLKANINSYKYHPEEEKRNVANELLAAFPRGTSIASLSYKIQTASMEKIFSDLDSNHAGNLSALGLTGWYAQLKQAQAEFEEKLGEYTSQKADKDALSTATDLRPALVKEIHKLLAFIPMQAEITGDESLQELSDQLVVEAARF